MQISKGEKVTDQFIILLEMVGLDSAFHFYNHHDMLKYSRRIKRKYRAHMRKANLKLNKDIINKGKENG
jgi:hypothetical protein